MTHSLGPWTKDSDVRLFSYRNTIHKIRLFIKQVEKNADATTHSQNSNSLNQKVVPNPGQILKINNPIIQNEIDRCVAKVLKDPPNSASPIILKMSDSRFVVEVRTWRAPPKLIAESHTSDQKIHPYSFKITGTTHLPLWVIPEPEAVTPEVPEIEAAKPEENQTSNLVVAASLEKSAEEKLAEELEMAAENKMNSSQTENLVPTLQNIDITENSVGYSRIEPDESVVMEKSENQMGEPEVPPPQIQPVESSSPKPVERNSTETEVSENNSEKIQSTSNSMANNESKNTRKRPMVEEGEPVTQSVSESKKLKVDPESKMSDDETAEETKSSELNTSSSRCSIM